MEADEMGPLPCSAGENERFSLIRVQDISLLRFIASRRVQCVSLGIPWVDFFSF